MKAPRLQTALRQIQDQFSNPVGLAVMAAVALILGVSGPFGTVITMDLPARLAYWGVVVPLTYAAGLLGTTLIAPTFTQSALWLRLLAQGLASALMVTLSLMALNTVLGLQSFDPAQTLNGFAAIFVICLAIEVLGAVLARHQSAAPQPTAAAAKPLPPRILARLPLEKRGALISLSVQDHYVSITTTAGSHLVLIRLADAVAEASPTPGLQVHRSHWVALDQVRAARRTPEAAILTVTGGAEIPVARSRLKAVLEAGLLAAPARKPV